MSGDRSIVTSLTSAQLHQLGAFFAEYVFPLYTLDRGRIKFLGTAFYVTHRGSYYLVSAGHVLEVYKHQPIAYYIEGRQAEEPRGLIYNKQADNTDFGVIEIEGPVRLRRGGKAMEFHHFDRIPMNIEDGSAVAMGYPASKNKPNVWSGEIARQAMFIRGGIREIPQPEFSGLDVNKHLAFQFDQSAARDIEGNIIVPPDAHGLSGSPVFWFPNPLDFPPPTLPCVLGIVSTRDKSGTVIVAVAAEPILMLIELLSIRKNQHRLRVPR